MKLFNIKNIPLTIILGFNIFTLLIFYSAPIDWKTDNMFIFFVYVTICQLMIVWGYRIGLRKKISKAITRAPFFSLSPKKVDFIFGFYTVTFLVKYAYLLRFAIFDVVGMFRFLSLGLADQQVGYQLSLDSSRQYTVNWSVYFFISIINEIFFIVGFLKWKDLSRFKKYIFIFFVVLEGFYWAGRGTNFGLITIITTFAFSAIYKMKNVKLNIARIALFSLILTMLLSVSIYIFSINMNSRRGHSQLDYQQFNLGLSTVNEHSVVFSFIPKPFHDSYMYVMSYFSQGYYHAALAFDLDYKPTYFLGNCPAIINLALVFGADVWEDTYMYRLKEKGVDPLINWHSAYVWYANDVTFVGVPFLLCALGYMLGASWSLSLIGNDFLSKIIFIILANMLLFLFANNSYLSSVFYSFIFILPVWYFTRVKRYKLS